MITEPKSLPTKRKAASPSASPGPSFSVVGTKKVKLLRNAQTDNSAGMRIASNFALSTHTIISGLISQETDLRFHFDSGGNTLVPVEEFKKNVSTNPGTERLITTLVTAVKESQVNDALETDFTAVAADIPEGNRGGGCGAGFQIYLKDHMLLTAGGGGGGGYNIAHDKILERGGGGGASIFIPGDDGDAEAHVGGGHWLADAKKGTVESKKDDNHDSKSFVEKLKQLRAILSTANPNDIAVLGGGGGGGGETELLRLRSQGEETHGGGYGFGFEIGSKKAIMLAKLGVGRPTRTTKAPDRLTVASFSCGQSYTKSTKSQENSALILPDHLLNEDWALKMAEYKGKYAVNYD